MTFKKGHVMMPRLHDFLVSINYGKLSKTNQNVQETIVN